MKQIITMTLLLVSMMAGAQTDLTGRIYANPNIMQQEMDAKFKDIDKQMADKRKEAIAKAEEKKGRKLTADEVKQIDDELAKAKEMVMAIKKGMKTAVSVEFKSQKDAVMRMDMNISDEALKAAGVGWLKRKALKVALAAAPKSQKVTYEVKGNLIITSDGEEKDTLHLSTDGKYLYGIMDEGKKKTKMTLTRTK